MRNFKKKSFAYFTAVAFLMMSAGFVLTENRANAVRFDGGVFCTCDPGDCVVGGAGEGQCNNDPEKSKCNRYDSNCPSGVINNTFKGELEYVRLLKPFSIILKF